MNIASATLYFSSRSCYNALIYFCHLQLQSRMARASQHHSCFPARSMQMFRHERLQTRVAEASHKIDQRTRIFCAVKPSLHSCSHFADLIFQSAPSALLVLACQSASRALAAVSCTSCQHLCQKRPATAETQTLFVTPAATIPVKTQGFAPESVFTRKFTCSRTLSLLNYLMIGFT